MFVTDENRMNIKFLIIFKSKHFNLIKFNICRNIFIPLNGLVVFVFFVFENITSSLVYQIVL